GDCDLHGFLPQDLGCEPEDWFPGACFPAGRGWGQWFDRAADLQRPVGCGVHVRPCRDGGGDPGGVGARVVAGVERAQVGGGARDAVRGDAVCGGAGMRGLFLSLEFLPGRASRVLAVVGSILREIFDESAYARFLERNKMESSREAYVSFLRESEALRARRARCC